MKKITFDSDSEDPAPGDVLQTSRSSFTVVTSRLVLPRIASRRFVLEVEDGDHGTGKVIPMRWSPRGRKPPPSKGRPLPENTYNTDRPTKPTRTA